MVTKKYPIGTKVKYIGSCGSCSGHTGKVIRVYDNVCRITLPHSNCSGASGGSITCVWSDIERWIEKNEQLLFRFMSE